MTILDKTITSLGGTPVKACNYNFTSVQDIGGYIKTAQLLENTGVSAYDGGVNGISDLQLQEVAATIATVEARHASFLNSLAKTSPFPNATDIPLTPLEVVTAAKGFFINCSGSTDLTSGLPKQFVQAELPQQQETVQTQV